MNIISSLCRYEKKVTYKGFNIIFDCMLPFEHFNEMVDKFLFTVLKNEY